MDDEDLVLVDESKSVPWNYVNRVEMELATNSSYRKVTLNPLMPRSYKEVVMTVSKACNHSRVGLLIDDEERYVAFMIIVDEDCIPFLLDDLENIETPMNAVYKVFYNTKIAGSSPSEGLLQNYMSEVVIPNLNNSFDSWNSFKYKE